MPLHTAAFAVKNHLHILNSCPAFDSISRDWTLVSNSSTGGSFSATRWMSYVWEPAGSKERFTAKWRISQEVDLACARLPTSLALQEMSGTRSIIYRTNEQQQRSYKGGGTWVRQMFTEMASISFVWKMVYRWRHVTRHHLLFLTLQLLLVLQQALLSQNSWGRMLQPRRPSWAAQKVRSGEAAAVPKEETARNGHQRWHTGNHQNIPKRLCRHRSLRPIRAVRDRYDWGNSGSGRKCELPRIPFPDADHLAIWFIVLVGRTPQVIRVGPGLERGISELWAWTSRELTRFIPDCWKGCTSTVYIYKTKPNTAIKEGSLMTGKGQTSHKEEDPENHRPVSLTFGLEEIMRYFLLESIPKDINDKATNQEQLTQICQLTDQCDCQDSYVEEGCNTTQLHWSFWHHLHQDLIWKLRNWWFDDC